MAEIIGTISAITAIAGACVTLGQKLTDCIETLSYAENDVEIIVCEVNIFSGLLTSFASVMKKIDADQSKNSAMMKIVTRQDLVVHIHHQSKLIKIRIRKFLKKLRSLYRKAGYSTIQRGIGRLRWYFEKSEFIFLKTFLDAAKSNMQLLLTLLLFATYMDPHEITHNQKFEPQNLKQISQQAELAKKCCARAEDRFEMQGLAQEEERDTMRTLSGELFQAEQQVQIEMQRKLQMEGMRESIRGRAREFQVGNQASRFSNTRSQQSSF